MVIKKTELIIFAALLSGFIVAAWFRNGVWKDEITFLTDVSSKSPHIARAHINLGNAFMNAGLYDTAIGHLKNSLASDPWYAESHYNLGVSYLKTGRFDEAIPEFIEALRINEVLRKGHFGEGVSLRNELGARVYLGNIYNVKGMFLDAVSHYMAALAISPDDASVRYNLALTLKKMGRIGDAKKEFEEVLRINPGDNEARGNLQALGGI
ncbi:MAG: tetratricopeptide repeat protein [Thermodesulfobacteriota bacterium]